MYQNFAQTSIKRHARTCCFDAVPCVLSTYKQYRISVSRPHLEGGMWNNDNYRSRKWWHKGELSSIVDDMACIPLLEHKKVISY